MGHCEICHGGPEHRQGCPYHPAYDDAPICPICGEEADTFHINEVTNELVGCDNCMSRHDAWEVVHNGRVV